MSEPNNSNLDSNDEMTPLDRVRKQLDRILSHNEHPDPERQQQVELKAEVERLLIEHDRSRSPFAQRRLCRIDNNRKDDDVLAEQLGDRNIILRLTEIKGLLERQEHIYKEKKRAKELRNRAISEYLVLGFVWVMGAFTMLIWLKF
jgi:hypothetical protein